MLSLYLCAVLRDSRHLRTVVSCATAGAKNGQGELHAGPVDLVSNLCWCAITMRMGQEELQAGLGEIVVKVILPRAAPCLTILLYHVSRSRGEEKRTDYTTGRAAKARGRASYASADIGKMCEARSDGGTVVVFEDSYRIDDAFLSDIIMLLETGKSNDRAFRDLSRENAVGESEERKAECESV